MQLLGFAPGDLEGLQREYDDWWKCKDCGGYPDDYMVFRSTWTEANMQQGFLCLPCLENRLERALGPKDFPRTANELATNKWLGSFPGMPRHTPPFANRLFWFAYELGRKHSEKGSP